MKYARKMVLVDINTTKQPTSASDDGVVKAINSLAQTTEFSKANYGPNAKPLAHLALELQEIVDKGNSDPAHQLRLYNQKLQKYLLLSRGNGNSQVSNTPNFTSPGAVPESESETSSLPEMVTIAQISPVPPVRQRTSSLFQPTPTTSKTPNYPTGRRGYRTNLPRITPKENRLRTVEQRRKNSRYKDFLVNWEPQSSTSGSSVTSSPPPSP